MKNLYIAAVFSFGIVIGWCARRGEPASPTTAEPVVQSLVAAITGPAKPAVVPDPVVRRVVGVVPGEPILLAGGAFTITFEAPKPDGNGVYVWASVRNANPARIAGATLDDLMSARDNFGNDYYASWTQYSHKATRPIHPGETEKVGWYFGRPVKGSVVTYRFGLGSDLIGEMVWEVK